MRFPFSLHRVKAISPRGRVHTKSLALLFALMFAMPSCYAQGANSQVSNTSTETMAPSEVGTTTMPSGQYLVIEQTTNKRYSLTVTNKGNMILGAAPAAAVQATGVQAGANAALPNQSNQAGDLVKGLAKQGMQRGMNELLKNGATKQLDKYIK